MLPLARRLQLIPRSRALLPARLPAHRFASTLTSPSTPPSFSPTPEATLAPSTKDEGASQRKAAYLWYNQIFPIRVGVWDVRYLVSRLQQEDLLAHIRKLVPKDYDVRVESVEPRAKDGGAFVRFSFKVPEKIWQEVEGEAAEGEVDDAVKQQRLREVEDKIAKIIEKEANDALIKSGWKPWFALGRPSRAFLVRGRPWMEDMNRFPSRELQVSLEGPELPQEQLYEVFRRFGKIHDIFPSGKTARVVYTSVRSATSARNALHASKVDPPSSDPSTPATVVRILYVDKQRTNFIKEWITGHPRITLPLLVALLGTVSYAVFDPIREFFVKNKIEGTFDTDRWVIVKWLKRETLGRLGLTGKVSALDKASGSGIEKEREEAKEQLETWLRDVPDTFIVVTGPRGSGKTALIEEVLADGKNVLTIDCDQLLKNARSDPALIRSLASATGYWPQFAFASTLNSWIDLAAMGLIGQKAGFSSTVDTQLKAILEVTSSSLSSIASSSRARAALALANNATRKEFQHEREAIAEQLRTDGVRDGRLDTVSGNGVLAELGGGLEEPPAGADKAVVEGEKVEIVGPRSASFVKEASRAAKDQAEGKEADLPAGAVERLPVVVIKGFSGKGEAKQEMLYDVLSEWAAVLVENQVAHVIFTSDASTVTKPLAKVLPSRPFNLVSLQDANPDASFNFVAAKLASFDQTLPPEAFPAVSILGGRQTDLELLVSKVRSGQSVDEAVDDIVAREASTIRKNFFGDDEEEAKGFKWSREQAWALVKGLSEKGELKYAETLLTTFGGDDTPLRALEAASLITVHHIAGRPSTIRPGKPVYRAACFRLLEDKPFAASIEFRAVSAGLKGAAGDIQSAQQELIELAKLFTEDGKWVFGGAKWIGGRRAPKEVEARVKLLLQKMKDAQAKTESLGAEKSKLLAVLKAAE